MMSRLSIPTEVEDYFASSPVGPMLELSRVQGSSDHPLQHLVSEALSTVPAHVISEVQEEPAFRGLHRASPAEQHDWLAREWALVNELGERISQRRRRILIQKGPRPAPYSDPAVADLPLSDDALVPLSEFDISEGVLLRKGKAFVVMLPTPSPNSYYWLTTTLSSNVYRTAAHVRLDPLIHGDASVFPCMSYRMLWWGPPLTWDDLVAVKTEKFGRWAPGPLGFQSEFTDYAWSPRADEQHLFLEEVPRQPDVQSSWSRYLHGIFSGRSRRVTHVDGAIRIYSDDDWRTRSAVHVHRSGKVGTRLKVFRLDGMLDPELIGPLGGTFFVWNYDVAHFFGMPVPEALRGSVA